jgi:hypothetical protein|tara:strand:+ start:1359 stop:2681 length:1323 start_codon:yes stop_codon:yes gene_type:complete
MPEPAATQISKQIYGGILHSDNYGHYVGLEFLACVAACLREGHENIPPIEDEVINLKHISHDCARFIAWGDKEERVAEKSDYYRAFSNGISVQKQDAVKLLLQSIGVPVPGRRQQSFGHNSHFLPYEKDLIHWDYKINRRSYNVSIENVYYRGAGTLIFNILRAHPDDNLRHQVGNKLYALLEKDAGGLSTLAKTLHKYDRAIEGKPQAKIDINDRERIFGPCAENLCHGLENILSHDKLTSSTKIDALLRFLPFALIRIQHVRSYSDNSNKAQSAIVDCGYKPGPIRRESKKSLENNMRDIDAALIAKGQEIFPSKNKNELKKMTVQFKSFYTRSAAAIGYLNSHSGVRHYVLKNDLLEALVLSEIPSDDERTFKDFLDDLFKKWGLVIGKEAASEMNLLETLDSAIFDENASMLVTEMKHLGFLQEYSDMTRMVKYGY